MTNEFPHFVHVQRLKDLFGFKTIESISLVHKGFKSLNYRLVADGTSFFLKEHTQRLSHVVHYIKLSEQYYADHGIPVILPIKDQFGRTAFGLDRHWCSLYPFVERPMSTIESLTPEAIISLSEMAGRIHLFGKDAPFWKFQPLRLWQKEEFLWEYQELLFVLNQKEHPNETDILMRETLERKRRMVTRLSQDISKIPWMNPCLIHGDLIYQNVFLDEKTSRVTHVFDFEKTCIAPRAYEFARSLMINCFDLGWGKEQFERAHLFLNAYRALTDISFEEFLFGMRLYWINLIHMTWMEASSLIFGQEFPGSIYPYHANRVAHLGDDIEDFCLKIYHS